MYMFTAWTAKIDITYTGELIAVSRGMQNFLAIIPKLYYGRILKKMKYKGQSTRSIWSIFNTNIICCEHSNRYDTYT